LHWHSTDPLYLTKALSAGVLGGVSYVGQGR